MGNNKRYGLFKLFLIFTMLNVFGIFLYENIFYKHIFNTAHYPFHFRLISIYLISYNIKTYSSLI